MPAVSVVIPTYNRLPYVGEAVESVLAQTLRDLEVIVVDDGSTDDTADGLRQRFGARIRIERFVQNVGRSAARNHGWSVAESDFVAFLDSDDLWLPRKLELQLPFFARPEVVLVHGWLGKIDADGTPLPEDSAEREQSFRRALARGYDYAGMTETWCMMYTSTVVVRRELLARTGGYDPALSDFEDWDLFWRIALEGAVATVPESVALHRKHEGNTPQSNEHWMTVCRKHLRLLEALPSLPARRRAQRNCFVNLALGEYWRGDLHASRRWMWRALVTDPGLLRAPNHPVWGAPLLHACLPHAFASRAVARLGLG